MHGFDKILVTGGCGAIGSGLVNKLKQKYNNTMFLNLDALTYAGNKDNIEPPYDNYRFIYGNICDASLVEYILNTERPDGIIHLAAETHVDRSFGNSLEFTKSNIIGTHCLLECVKRYIEGGHRFGLFLYMSTDEVYGSVDDDESPRLENSLFKPSNPYSATKASAELLCHAYMTSFNIPITIVRCNNVISRYQHEEKLIPKTIRRIKNNERVPVHGDGSSKRTFIHVDDIASAIDVIIEKGAIGSIYNIGTENEHSVLEVIQTVLDVMRPGEKKEDWIDFVPDRAFQDYRYSIDSSELRRLGWSEQKSFDDAIQDVIEHIQHAPNY